MKKIFLLMLVLLNACVLTNGINDAALDDIDNAPVIKRNRKTKIDYRDDKPVKKRKQMPGCLDFSKVKVFQVLDDGYALADVCEDYNSKYCIGKVVLLAVDRKYEYYDEMIVEPEADKCFMQAGVYRYETKNGKNKTVPRVGFIYKYYADTEEERLYRIYEMAKDERFWCERAFKLENRSDNGICECRELYMKKESGRLKNITWEKVKIIIDDKCGKI